MMTRILGKGWERCPGCGQQAPEVIRGDSWTHSCDPGLAERARILVQVAVTTRSEEAAQAARRALADLMARVGVLEELLKRTRLERADLLALSDLFPRQCFCGRPGVRLGRKGPLCIAHAQEAKR